MAHVTSDQDPATFERLSHIVWALDPAYAGAVVERIYTSLFPKTDEELRPPEGCLFVTVNLGGLPPRRVLLTLQECMLGAPGVHSPYKVTPGMVEAEISKVAYCTPPSGKAVICEITLRNGFVVRAESAVTDEIRFDFDTGASIAYQKALAKVYELVSFRLQDALQDLREGQGLA